MYLNANGHIVLGFVFIECHQSLILHMDWIHENPGHKDAFLLASHPTSAYASLGDLLDWIVQNHEYFHRTAMYAFQLVSPQTPRSS